MTKNLARKLEIPYQYKKVPSNSQCIKLQTVINLSNNLPFYLSTISCTHHSNENQPGFLFETWNVINSHNRAQNPPQYRALKPCPKRLTKMKVSICYLRQNITFQPLYTNSIIDNPAENDGGVFSKLRHVTSTLPWDVSRVSDKIWGWYSLSVPLTISLSRYLVPPIWVYSQLT